MNELLKLNFANQIWQIVIPLVLMGCDIITGYYNAWKKKKVKSAKMRDGIGKKIAELVYILIGFLFSYAFNLQIISYFVCIYIIYMELVSVAENCDKLGIKLPKFISEKLNEENDYIDTKKNKK